MLVIRPAQIEALREPVIADFVERVVERLARVYPEPYQAMGDAGARAFVWRAVEAAERHGIDTEGDVSALIDLKIQVGEGFERSPDRAWAAAVLAHPTLPGSLKVSAIVQRIASRTQGRVVEPA